MAETLRVAAWLLSLLLGSQILLACTEFNAGRVFRSNATVVNAKALQQAKLVVIASGTPLNTRGVLGSILNDLGYEVSYAVPEAGKSPVGENGLSVYCRELGVSRRGGGNTATVQCTLEGLLDRKPVFLGEGEYMHRCWGCAVVGAMVREDWEGATRAALAKLPRAGTRIAEP
ncbi:MAG: hypothetical protein ABT940_13745, partial [Alphaproteobacteria bacterium]